MISVQSKGSFKKTDTYLQKLLSGDPFSGLDKYGKMGVDALARNTPKRSGATANAWAYEIEDTGDTVAIHWYNTNTNGTANIAILLQYGHGTGTGGYVSGRDYINPAIKPIFDKIAEEVWKAVTNG